MNLVDPDGTCSHGSLVGEINRTTSASPFGGNLGNTFANKVELGCKPKKLEHWLVHDASKAMPCWKDTKWNDMSTVKETSSCKAVVTTEIAAEGDYTAVVAGYGGLIGGKAQPFHIDELGQQFLQWHEDGHAKLAIAYLRAFWERGKKSLGGARSETGYQVPEWPNVPDEEARNKWKEYWEALKKGMENGVKGAAMDGLQYSNPGGKTFHSQITNGFKAGRSSTTKDGTRFLIKPQRMLRYAEKDDNPKVHEESGTFRALAAEAARLGRKDAEEFDKFPCECTEGDAGH